MQRSYRIGDSAFAIRTTSQAFGEWLDEALTAYRVSRPVDVEYSIVVDGGRPSGSGGGQRFHILYWGVGAVTRSPSLATLTRGLFAELESRLLYRRDDAVYVHAGVMSVDGITILVPAWLIVSLNGLSARILERAGARLPTARWVAVDPTDGRVMKPRPLLDVADPPRVISPNGHADARVRVDRPFQVDAVMTVDRAVDSVALGSRAHALHALGAVSANLGVLGGAAVDGLAHLVAGARCYRSDSGAPRRALESLRAIAAHERAHR